MKKLLFLYTMVLVFVIFGIANAEFANWSFEDGLTGLTVESTRGGELEVLNCMGCGIVTPTDGNYFLYMSTGPGDVYSDNISDQLRIWTDTFNIGPGLTTLSFDYMVLTNEPASEFFHDEAEVFIKYPPNQQKIVGVKSDYDVFSSIPGGILTPTGSFYSRSTGWQNVVLDVSGLSGIDVLLSFEVLENDNGGIYDTALLIDNINVRPPENQPPTSDAGPDQIVFDEIALDGSQSNDPEGVIVSYQWQLIHREDSDYNRTATGVTPTVSDLKTGFYDVTLTVLDDEGALDTDEMLFSATGLKGDFDFDGDVDGSDLAKFASNFGVTGY